MKRTIGALVLLLALAVVRQAGAAESCYFTRGSVSADCDSQRVEAEDYLAKSHQSCALVIYISWSGTRETVRCRGYDGATLDYVSGTDGNLHFMR
jgi:hypothetical protein